MLVDLSYDTYRPLMNIVVTLALLLVAPDGTYVVPVEQNELP